MTIDHVALREKWMLKWSEAKIFEANPDPNKPKYFITVAYPYPNAPQHIGHGRTYTLTDVHARYMRMQGYNVLFPMGFHYTGTPILAMSERLVQGDGELLDAFTRIYKVHKEVLKEFQEPLKMARYFHQELKIGMIEMGYSIDWRREFTTIDPQYSKFIEWQFKKLRDLGFITQGSHPVGWCPKDGSPVGQHDTLGDVEPEIGEYTLLKFRVGDLILPTATLRPETVFGVTNIWVRPELEYVKAKVGGETWIVSGECVEKLNHLNRAPIVEGRIKGAELVGKAALNPMTKRSIPILPASFVDPGNGSGVVMSVPAHAPYDYQALLDLSADVATLAAHQIKDEDVRTIQPISLVESEGYSEVPARDIIQRKGIKSQKDPSLEEATTELYAHEFHRGRMKGNTGRYSGLSVSDARDAVKADMIQSGDADSLYEIMNKPVKCRCGTECVVKIFENQWFINYGDPGWKEKAKRCAAKMSFLPEEIRPEFEYTIGWLRGKACARKSGLGTKLPWDRGWIIESLSDSVIYMAYYTISRFLVETTVGVDSLREEVFNYVFLGIGDAECVGRVSGIPKETLEAMRREFVHFYPLDCRHSGRDLVPNHLTFFIFNHSAIFPEELWPKQIVVNGSVLMEGKKMSKSFGNIIPLREAIQRYGTDPIRLTLLATAELLQDADISLDLVKTFNERLEKLFAMATLVSKHVSEKDIGEEALEDRWILSRLQRYVAKTTDAMNRLRAREAIQQCLYNLDQEVDWYLRRSSVCAREDKESRVARVLSKIVDVRVRLLAPFSPFVCEEIWQTIGGNGMVSTAPWPKVDESKVDLEAEAGEALIQSVLADVLHILKVTKMKPSRVILYVATGWKWMAYLKALSCESGKVDMSVLMETLLQESELKRIAKDVSHFASRLVKDLPGIAPEVRTARSKFGVLNEHKVLSSATRFLSKELDAKVEVYREDDSSRDDPKDRSQLSQPYRPGIYVE